MYRTARRSYGPAAALIGLLAILFLPSLFLWSILPLKESVYFFCMAIAILATVWVFRSRTWLGSGVALLLMAASFLAIDSLRVGGVVIALGGLALGLVATVAIRRWFVAVALLVAAPFAVAWTAGQPGVHERILQAMRD